MKSVFQKTIFFFLKVTFSIVRKITTKSANTTIFEILLLDFVDKLAYMDVGDSKLPPL